jgi:polysaccharide export outer membrane protein
MAYKLARRILLTAFVAAAAVATAAAQGAPKIAARDQLTVLVFGVEELSGKFAVGADGTITYPHLGAIPVAGQTTRDVEAHLTKKLKEAGYLVNPQVTVELVQTPNKRVIITGAVRSPGQLPFGGELTLFEALALVGSTTSEAGDLVLVLRADANGNGSSPPQTDSEGNDVIEVSLTELQSGRLAENIMLNDGDHIVVPRAQQVFINGQVRSPGAYSIPSGATVLQAITLAGGLTDRGTYRGMRILRDKKELKNVKQDTIVKPGDTIIVKASPF